ncbi:hypothetical protein [Vibrio alfacsensis]|uniref:hypothetical protein n=1 Tax=Vibrio alfacsensis TaxID=1074311 RepID=UPI001BF182B0|nr:hypothetical protein [Vibrio alfacsensis]BCN23150.1 hypothetical protein VYA_03420 [Vibrio alfacsensis]
MYKRALLAAAFLPFIAQASLPNMICKHDQSGTVNWGAIARFTGSSEVKLEVSVNRGTAVIMDQDKFLFSQPYVCHFEKIGESIHQCNDIILTFGGRTLTVYTFFNGNSAINTTTCEKV